MIKWLACGLLLSSLICADEKEICRRIENHLIVRDVSSAMAEAEQALSQCPHSLMVHELAIKAFSRGCDEKRALDCFTSWKNLCKETPPRRIYEELAWGIIGKCEKSSSPMIRTISIIAAFYGQDARGIKVIARGLGDPNVFVRQTAAEVAGKMPDEPLKKAVLNRLNCEQEWDVRLELILAIGTMKMTHMKSYLIQIIADPKTMIEEKGAATESLLALLEEVPRDELLALSKSDRASLRALSAEIITCLHVKDSVDILWTLLDDPRAEVRGQAVLGLGVLREPIKPRLLQLLQDREFHVQLGAAYAILLTGSFEANQWVDDNLRTGTPDEKRLVAAMLAATGSYGMPLAKKNLHLATDLYVRMNLALALMDKESLDILYSGVTQNSERWSRERKGVFKPLIPSLATHKPLVPNYPDMLDKETRLEILNLLAIKEHPKALIAVRQFLKEKGWGLAGTTSVLLLTEGDDGAVDLVRALLKDNDPEIRLQAALILSRWDPEEGLSEFLTQNYDSLSRERKEMVIQAMGEIGDEKSISFLVQEMASPHASIRLIASATLLKSLYD